MQYLLLIHSNEAGFASMPKEQIDQYLGAYTGYTEALKKAGILVDANRLQPIAAATTVRIANGKTQVLERALCRDQGTARRLLSDRGA